MYAKGDKVQAVDEIGRWEEARVLDSAPDGIKVSFVGWAGVFNRTVSVDEIRRIVDPFQEDFRVQSRKREASGRRKTDLLKTICRGDEVSFDNGGLITNATVKLVDRFRRRVTIVIGEEEKEVPVSDLSAISAGTESYPSTNHVQRPSKKRATPVNEQVQQVYSSVQVQTDTNTPGRNYQEVYTVACFMNKYGENITVGSVVNLPYGLLGVVKTLTLNTVSCSPPVSANVLVYENNKLDLEMTVRLPVDRLHMCVTKVALSREVKAVICDFHAISKSESVQHLLHGGPLYRKLHRRNQLAMALRREVGLGLRTKSRYRRFSLGLLSVQYDEEICKINGRRKKFEYKDKSIAEIDSLLGEEWDILAVQTIVTFVTQLSLWVTKDNFLAGSVRAAVCRENISLTCYRDVLKNHLTKEHDDAADESDDEDTLVL